MRTINLSGGESMPALGQGTWGWAQDPASRSDEIASLRCGIDLGMSLIDTAEMYADGGAEELIGEAIAGRRDGLFIVDKAPRSGRPAHVRQNVASLDVRLSQEDLAELDAHFPPPRGPQPLELL
jgi:diketogulonate reductase-like aldo/keto reductase